MKFKPAIDKIMLLPLSVAITVLVQTLDANPAQASGTEPYSVYTREDLPRNVYWGDTHVHTNISADAFGFGGVLSPEDAYRFAKGSTVTSSSGQPARLSRPLDFIVVSDHAEYMGVSAMLTERGDELANSAIGQRWLKFLGEGRRDKILMDSQKASTGELGVAHDESITRSVWAQVTKAADRHNDPGTFTAFIGYEWSSLPDGNNLHRNVVFRDGADVVNTTSPFSTLDSRNPEDLWRYLQGYEERSGGKVLAIPHNANVSNGLMFSDKTFLGEPLTKAYAEARARWEPFIEVTQMKGDGETHPFLSPEDEFADFETWDNGNFAQPKVPKQTSMLRYEYARSALKQGLALEDTLGVNPFKFGMIGSTDTHTSLSAVEENNYFGKFAIDEPSAKRAHSEPMPASTYAAAGYAAVWSESNTRESLFNAFKRKEVYATTGPRMTVRFFGGWNFENTDVLRPNYVDIGYNEGVPMGGELSKAPTGKSPVFLILAAKDPMGANLDRVQIVKGWLDAEGQAHEKVFDAALSGNRGVNPQTGKAPDISSTVDIETATYTNSVGSAQLATVWRDPEFDRDSRAFYYLRVLEIPTPRWTTYDSAYYGSDLPTKVPAEIQERAYTSPIWFTP